MSRLPRAGVRGLIGIGVLASALSGASAAAAAADPAAHAHAARAAVRSVSNPPAVVPRTLRVRIVGSASAVSLYASPGQRLVKGDVRLAARAMVRRHSVTVRMSRRLPAGAWFIVACPAGRHGGCAASHRAMLEAPSRFSAPVQARPVAETARASSATIGRMGGTLTATAADGTGFRLDIPANSVPDGTHITMTPLSALTGARWVGKLVGAVHLAPEGLALIRGATLTITPKRPVPLRTQIAVGYTGDGSDLHPVPLAPSRTAIQIPLAHFSGAGLGSVAGGATPPSTSGSATDAYNSELAGILGQWREGDLSTADMENAANIVFNAEYKTIMDTEVPPGMNDDTAAQTAIADLLQWARSEALLLSNDVLGRITPTIQKLLEGMYARAQQKCASQHDLTQLTRIIGFDRSEQLLGLNLHTVTDDLKCARFRVDFDSTITITPGGSSGAWTLEYVAHPTISFLDIQEGGGPVFAGAATGSYAKVQGTVSSGHSWTEAAFGTGATFTVETFCLPAANSACPQPSLMFDVGMPTETYVRNDGSQTPPVPYFAIGWQIVHASDRVQAIGPTAFVLSLSSGSGALIGHGTFAGAGVWGGTGRVSENTTIDVYHTPPGS